MKIFFKLVCVIVFTAFCFCAFAQTKPQKFTEKTMIDALEYVIDSLGHVDHLKSVSKEIDLAEKFQEAEILGDITLVLTNGPQNKLLLKESSLDGDRIKIKTKNGKLIINAEKETGSKAIVYLSAAGVSSLLISGNSEIFSLGTINTDALQIVLDGTAMVSLRYNGQLNVIAGERAELIDIGDYKKLISRK